MKLELTERECMDIQWSILMAIHHVEKQREKEKKELESPLTKKLLKLHDTIAVAMEKKKDKPKTDPFDPRKVKYYASKGFYQQLTAADMMGYKSEASLVKYRKNGILKENIHWIRTVGRGISYSPEKCKEAIRKARGF